MAINKVIYSGNTLIDVTDCDVTEVDVAKGKKFIKKTGEKAVGTSTGGGASSANLGSYFNKSVTEVTAADLDGATIIPDSAFANCKNLTSVVIPDNITFIGLQAFYGCNNLTSVTISDSVTNIKDSAFSGCSKLNNIIIGSGVTNIGIDAFYNCYSLTDVYYVGYKSDWDSISIHSSNTRLTKATIHFIGRTETYTDVETRLESNSLGETLYITTKA